MPITEFAILVFSPPHSLLDPTIRSLFQKLTAWQSECSGFPLFLFTNPDDASEVHLITGWDSIEAHDEWIKGDRNQELLRVFTTCIDLPSISMVHLDIDFESIPKGVGTMVVERYDKGGSGVVIKRAYSNDSAWSQLGRDLAEGSRYIYHFASGVEEFGGAESGSRVLTATPRWELRRVEVCVLIHLRTM
ncbi:hypothetical protein BS17DRAFT_791617 [Gyrodon lividus]|nr:hypothetical protein BS17DRAFT_791617 [Gyrodon lividus]